MRPNNPPRASARTPMPQAASQQAETHLVREIGVREIGVREIGVRETNLQQSHHRRNRTNETCDFKTREFNASHLASSPEMLHTLSRVLEAATKKLRVVGAALSLFDHNKETLFAQQSLCWPDASSQKALSQTALSQSELLQGLSWQALLGGKSEAQSFAKEVLLCNRTLQWQRGVENAARFPVFSQGEAGAPMFAAAAPLRDEKGGVFGVLSVIGRGLRVLDVEETELLEDMAAQLAYRFESRFELQNAQQNAADAIRETHLLRDQLGDMGRLNNQLQVAVQNAAIGIVVSNPYLPDNPVMFANPAFFEMTGYKPHEIIGKNCRILQGPSTNCDVIQSIRASVQAVESCRHTLVNYRQDGTPFWNDITVKPVFDQEGRLVNFVGIQRDVTDSIEKEAIIKRAHDEMELRVQMRTMELSKVNDSLTLSNITLEKEVKQHFLSRSDLEWSRQQLRALAARLESAQEAERTRISREIHDDLGQELTSLKMQLAWLERRSVSADKKPFFEGDDLPNHLQEMSQQIDSAIRSVRRIASDLRPEVLDHFGLCEALKWQAQEFQRKAGIRCLCQCRIGNVEPELATTIFRITQEALTNIMRHAQATRVRLTLKEENHALHLCISDNGIGINRKKSEIEKADSNDKKSAPPLALGIIGMSERALIMGGDFSIKSRAGQSRGGTTIRVLFPLKH